MKLCFGYDLGDREHVFVVFHDPRYFVNNSD